MASNESRNVHVSITADTTQYVAALNDIAEAAERLKAAGVSLTDIPRAVGATVALAGRLDELEDAIALGYAPNDWNGMWKLPHTGAITWISGNWALVREIVYKPGTHIAALDGDTIKTRLVLRRRKRPTR